MELKGVCGFAVIALIICLAQTTVGFPNPRVAIVDRTQEQINEESMTKFQDQKSKEKTHYNEITIPGGVWCQFEETTEDSVCAQHCLPKGYSYGLCINNKCSCI